MQCIIYKKQQTILNFKLIKILIIMRATATKAGRLDLQNYQFTALTNKGFNREDYADLKIFTLTDDSSTWVKIYRGTASKEIVCKRYRTEAQAVEVIKNAKASHDRRKAYKEELKANPTKSSSANCATAIREELKKEFAGVKFKVTSQNFSGGDSVHISWSEGPTERDVNEFTNKYQYGSFNGMEDIYEYSNSRDDLPQTKYVQTRREISEETNNTVFESLLPHLPTSSGFSESDVKNYAYRIIKKTSIPLGSKIIGVERKEENGSIEDVYILKIELSETAEEPKTAPNFEAVEVTAGEIQIVDYSEKAIAVIGDTKPIKDKLKELGGRFNFRLSCGAGWIFPKTKLEEVEAFLSA